MGSHLLLIVAIGTCLIPLSRNHVVITWLYHVISPVRGRGKDVQQSVSVWLLTDYNYNSPRAWSLNWLNNIKIWYRWHIINVQNYIQNENDHSQPDPPGVRFNSIIICVICIFFHHGVMFISNFILPNTANSVLYYSPLLVYVKYYTDSLYRMIHCVRQNVCSCGQLTTTVLQFSRHVIYIICMNIYRTKNIS